MSTYIEVEVRLMAKSLALGVILMVSYDALRLFRMLVPHSSLATGIEDFGYWMYSAVMTFSLLFYENSGIVRGYVIVCVFLAMIFYDRIVSQRVFMLLKKASRWITIKRYLGWGLKKERK